MNDDANINSANSEDGLTGVRYLIRSREEDTYWSKESGWGGIETADAFSEEELQPANVPPDGYCVPMTAPDRNSVRKFYRVTVSETWRFADTIEVIAAHDDEAVDFAVADFADSAITFGDGVRVDRDADIENA